MWTSFEVTGCEDGHLHRPPRLSKQACQVLRHGVSFCRGWGFCFRDFFAWTKIRIQKGTFSIGWKFTRAHCESARSWYILLRHVSQCFMALLFVYISFAEPSETNHTHTSQIFTDDILSSINVKCMYMHTCMVKAQRNPYGCAKSGSNAKWNITGNSNICRC